MSSSCEINSMPSSEPVRLTELCRCAGCAAKIRAKDIEEVLRSLPLPADSRVLAGHQSADDAVVVSISADLALVQTVDFFPPVVDEPRRYGRIAAANSLSDVYAMGGVPLSAMNITCFPTKKYGTELLSEILQGGLEKVLEAGAVLAGGHTVEDDEPKFGLAVTGTINPRRIIAKGGAQAGDVLVLTKPLGTGVLNTALRAGDISAEAQEALLSSMETLNREASLAMVKSGVIGATDITGYGLLGHALEMAKASDVSIEIKASQVPFLPETMEAYQKGYYPNGSFANRQYVAPYLDIASDVSDDCLALLADAQTSGGLLIAVAASKLEALLAELDSLRVAGHIVGRCAEKGAHDKWLRIV
ncbi:MAG: selenide, water dikinase SelD [bacterium]|nr:selenide, water dikinase SelD [bacterium]